MLAAPVPDPALPPGWAGKTKWDGFRALVSVDAGQVVLRSKRGTEMGPSFPEVVAGTVQLPDATALHVGGEHLAAVVEQVLLLARQDDVLTRHLGSAYMHYAATTTHRLIPGVW